MWGYFVYQGTVDPLGRREYSLAAVWHRQPDAGGDRAMLLCTTVLIKMKRERYIWVTLVPTAWLLVCTTVRGLAESVFAGLPVGFFAIAQKYSDAAAAGTVLAPAKSVAEMQRVAFNNYLCGAITALFVACWWSPMAVFAIRMSLNAIVNPNPSVKESAYQPSDPGVSYATVH
jgi:carbon starvation protein CstA